MNPLDNAAIAELLWRASEAETREQLSKAMRRAARRAFAWPAEAADLVAAGRTLRELDGIGPSLERVIRAWIDEPPPVPEPDPARRGFLTFTAAEAVLDREPGLYRSIRGDLQTHTVHSDGGGTVLEMARAAVERGYEYLAVTDHSKGLKIAGGLSEERLAAQSLEIDAVAATLDGLRLLRGVEMNLNPQGEGDMDPAALARLDVVVGAFHSALRRTGDQTDRYLAALRNPHVDVLAHPRGRIYGLRPGLVADWPRVFAEAAARDVAVEIDGYPDRQDLDAEHARIAVDAGCWFAVDTDAHAPDQLSFVAWSAALATKAGVPHDRVLNLLPHDDLAAWIAQRRARAGWS